MALSGQGTISIEWCLVVLTLNFVVLRLVARLLVQRDRMNIGDVLVILAWMAFASTAACDTWLLKLGLMQPSRTYNDDLTHLTDDPDKNAQILKVVYGSALPYYLALWLVKGALISFFYTIIPTSLSRHRKALHGVTAFVFATLLIVQSVNIFWCAPIHRNWSLDKEDICFSFASIPVFIISTACNILTDIAIFVLPFPLLRGLKIQHRSQLVGLVVIFGLGGFTMLATAVRVVILADAATITHVAVLSAVEVAVGIIVASLPSLRILFRNHGVNLTTNRSRSRNVTGGSNSRSTGVRQARPTDWIYLEEGEIGDTESTWDKNRDTIKSHSTVLTFPTISELEEIICEKQGTPPVRSIDDLQRFHDSVLFHRDSNEASTAPGYEWTFDKVQWRYTEPLPPSPITVNGLGVIPDIVPNPTLSRQNRLENQIPPLPMHTYQPERKSR